MKSNKSSGSLHQGLSALSNVIKDLYRKVPVLFYGLASVIFLGMYGISNSPSLVLSVMSTLVGLLSVGIYFKNKSFSESLLAFFLGLLTVFSITWNHTNTIVFSSVFIAFCIIYFLIASVKTYAELETIISQAAGFTPEKHGSRQQRFEQLKSIADKSTTNSNLGIIDKAKTVRFFAYIKLPIESMATAINTVEMLKSVYEMTLEDTHKFYRSVYLITKRTEQDNVSYSDINNMFLLITELPLTPEDFFQIFNATKKNIIRNSTSFDVYLSYLKHYVEQGLDNENIIDELNNAQ